MQMALLSSLLIPCLAAPIAYALGKKSDKVAALVVALVSLIDLYLLYTTLPTIAANGRYVESYYWMPMLGSTLTLFVDGISLSMAVITLVLIFSAAVFSMSYMTEKKTLSGYYAMLSLLTVGLVGVFITSNLLFFYFCWELMLIPTYFIIGGWGYKEPYRAAFKFFIFTHAGAVFVLLGIGAVYMLTGTLDIFQAGPLLATASSNILGWVLAAFTLGFAVKMAIVPVHMWLPDAHSEAPAPMSAILSGVIIEAGAYAILRISLGTVFPALPTTGSGSPFLHILTIFGVVSAFYGAFTALAEKDIKRIIAYSSISHMGYVLFGLSLFPFSVGLTGTVYHLITHGVSKGLLFLIAGAIMMQTKVRNIDEMGGLAGKMPLTATSAAIAAFSIAGAPPFACFISEFLIFIGGVQAGGTDSFYFLPTALMLIATVFSLAYVLRFFWKVFLGSSKIKEVKEVPIFMTISMGILAFLVVLFGIWPQYFIDLISSVSF
jgi:NADH-quinone oxidoreductase subunit M